MTAPAPDTAPQVPAIAPAPGRREPRRMGIDALHVFSLINLVVAQTFYDRLARQTNYLVDPRVTPAAIAAMGVCLSFGLPLLIVGLECLAGLLRRRLRESVHLGVVLLCGTLLCLQLVRRLDFLPGWLLIAGALGTACGLTWGYERFASLRSVVTMASLGIVVFPGMLWMRLQASDTGMAYRATRDATVEPVPVVMVVFDEFCGASLLTPERDIDATRFPHFSALRQSATWYRGASSVSPSTLRALPSLLTGNYMKSEIIPSSTEFPQNLFSVMQATGHYDLALFEPVSIFAPRYDRPPTPDISDGFRQTVEILNVLGHVYLFELCPPDLHSRLPTIPGVWFGLHDSSRVNRSARRGAFRYGWTDRRDQQVEHFLQCVDSTPQSTLYFGHFLIPHAPWCYFPSGTRYAPDRHSLDQLCLESDSSIMSDELGVIQNQQRHLLQAMYVDTVVGRLRQRLEQVGIWDRCLLIVTADHGISFRLGQDRREFSGGNAEDLLSVPLFIKRPGQTAGEVSDLPVQSTDLFPTILDQVGIHPAAPMAGLSLRDPRLAQRDQIVVRDPTHDLTFSPNILGQSTVPDQIRQRFGVGTDRWNLFRIGPHSEWLGLPVKSLPTGTGSRLKLECWLPPQPANSVEPDLPFCHIEGRVVSPGQPEKPVELLAVVNGIVCGTTRTYHQFGYTDRWSVMLPEWSYPEESASSRPEYFSVSEEGTLTACEMVWVENQGPSSVPR